MSDRDEKVKKVRIAKVVNTHGVRGEVKAVPLSDFPDRYASLKQVFVEGDKRNQVCTVESVRWNKGHLLMKFEEIDNPEHAGLLKNKYLVIPIDDVIPLPEDSFYLFEIIGLDVYHSDGGKIGTVKDVLQTSANDVYVIQDQNEKEVLIPALKNIVKQVDLENNLMIVQVPPGLLD